MCNLLKIFKLTLPFNRLRRTSLVEYLMIKKLGILFLLFQLSCSNEPPTLFELNTEVRLELPPGLDNFNTHILIINNIPSRIKSVFDPANADLISGIYASRAVFTSSIGTQFDFSIIHSVVVNIWDPRKPQDKMEVFYMDLFNNQGGKDLQLFSSLADVKEILLNDTFDAEVRIVFRAITPAALDSRLTMNFVAHGK